MNILLIMLYLFITISTGVLFFIIIKYLKEKPFGKQFVTDHLNVSLSASIFADIAFLSMAVILREIIGPFYVSVGRAVIIIKQFFQLNYLVLYYHTYYSDYEGAATFVLTIFVVTTFVLIILKIYILKY